MSGETGETRPDRNAEMASLHWKAGYLRGLRMGAHMVGTGQERLLPTRAEEVEAKAVADAVLALLPAPHPQGGTDREALARVRRVLDDELANLADDGARLSHSVVRRIEAALAAPAPTEAGEGE